MAWGSVGPRGGREDPRAPERSGSAAGTDRSAGAGRAAQGAHRAQDSISQASWSGRRCPGLPLPVAPPFAPPPGGLRGGLATPESCAGPPGIGSSPSPPFVSFSPPAGLHLPASTEVGGGAWRLRVGLSPPPSPVSTSPPLPTWPAAVGSASCAVADAAVRSTTPLPRPSPSPRPAGESGVVPGPRRTSPGARHWVPCSGRWGRGRK